MFEDNLSGFAASSRNSLGRKVGGHSHDCYLEDKARIIRSKAFHRLQYKTQVFVNHGVGDHYRNRLTHSMEVANIAKVICRKLSYGGVYLNEDLAECIGLAHDLGHAPFGHCGQDSLDDVMEAYGGFEHNFQSIRILTELEHEFPGGRGLDLCFETLEGVVKHRSPAEMVRAGKFSDYMLDKQATLEAQIGNFADEIAYNCHDIEDGHRSGIVSFESLMDIPIFLRLYENNSMNLPNNYMVVRHVTEMIREALINDCVSNIMSNLKKYDIESLDDIRGCKSSMVSFSSGVKKENGEMKKFLYKNLYLSRELTERSCISDRIVKGLFSSLMSDPTRLRDRYYEVYVKKTSDHGDAGSARSISDYIAGMTDRFAIEEYDKVYGHGAAGLDKIFD